MLADSARRRHGLGARQHKEAVPAGSRYWAKLVMRGHRVVTRRSAAAPTSADPLLDAHELWKSFSARVSGEWDGVTATFAPNGKPQQLPEHYVPEAFREWGVEIYDWQSQCSSVVIGDQLRMVVRRMMPTVGCEADAIAFTEDGSGGADTPETIKQGLAVLADGSYSRGPLQLDPAVLSRAKLEHCLAREGGRIKVIQNLMLDWSTKDWTLQSVELHKEVLDGPYTGRRELAGCGGGQPPIAGLPAAATEQLRGPWQPVQGVLYVASSGEGLEASGGVRCSVQQAPEGAVTTLLPLGAWSRISIQAGDVYAEAGVLVEGKDADQARVSMRRYVGLALERAALGTEQRGA